MNKIQRDRNCSNFIISYNNGEREIRRFQVRSRKYALYNVSFFDRIKEQTKCFTNFRSIIVFPFVRSIISHRGVSIERRLKWISSIGATLIYIGVHRNSDHSKIKRGKNDTKSPRTLFPPYKGGTRTFGISRNWRAIMPRSGIIDRDRKKKKIASQKFRSRGKEKAITLLDLGTMAHQRICRKIIPLFGIECKPDCTWRKSGESNESNFSDGISILVSLEFIETLFGLNCRFN